MSRDGRHGKDGEWISLAGLQLRGWTRAAVRAFLGDPDQRVRNPRGRRAPEICLYRFARVEQAERSAGWQAWKDRNAHRLRASTKAVATKRARLLAQVEALPIQVPALALADLQTQAIHHYNMRETLMAERHGWREWDGEKELAKPSSDPRFLARITVNYLRHRCTKYEEHLQGIFGRVGVREVYTVLFRRIVDAIAAAYPHLAEECRRQIDAKGAGVQVPLEAAADIDA